MCSVYIDLLILDITILVGYSVIDASKNDESLYGYIGNVGSMCVITWRPLSADSFAGSLR